jgi:uncharacterized cupredoxin-like copper-binding protein
MRRFVVVALGPLLLVAAAGCGSSSKSSSTKSTSAAAPAAAPTTPTPPTGAVAIGVTETEYKLTPANISPKSGKHTILAMNRGTVTHSLMVEGAGPGGKDVRAPDIAPGTSATITVDLKPGKTYNWYCPIDGHRALGVRGTIKVAGSSASTSSSAAKPSTSSGSSSSTAGSSGGTSTGSSGGTSTGSSGGTSSGSSGGTSTGSSGGGGYGY